MKKFPAPAQHDLMAWHDAAQLFSLLDRLRRTITVGSQEANIYKDQTLFFSHLNAAAPLMHRLLSPSPVRLLSSHGPLYLSLV